MIWEEKLKDKLQITHELASEVSTVMGASPSPDSKQVIFLPDGFFYSKEPNKRWECIGKLEDDNNETTKG